ncbi:MAG: hypothetical protein HQM14_11950 [SAR324 cluster bacterium]|nr:hypothetical protein [SAR324 cluster bacterium]
MNTTVKNNIFIQTSQGLSSFLTDPAYGDHRKLTVALSFVLVLIGILFVG